MSRSAGAGLHASARSVSYDGRRHQRTRLFATQVGESGGAGGDQRRAANEAEVIAAEAKARAPGELAGTVEIVDESGGLKLAYAIGTADPAGRFIELGTAQRPATPWLWPVFRTRSPGIKRRLATLITAGFRTGLALSDRVW